MAASLRISELTALSTVDDADLFLVTDSSSTTSKHASLANIRASLLTGNHGINLGAAGQATSILGNVSFPGAILANTITTTGAVAFGGDLTVSGNLSVTGTTTQINTVTMTATNAIVFEGATADDNESTLTIIDPTADRTIKLPNQSGCLPVLAVDSTTAITATPEELNKLDGVTSTTAELNTLAGVTAGSVTASKAVVASADGDVNGFRNVSMTGTATVKDLMLATNYSDTTAAGTPTLGKIAVIDSELYFANGTAWLQVTAAGLELE